MCGHWMTPIFRAAIALWFALVVGEPGIVKVCSAHGTMGAPSVVAHDAASHGAPASKQKSEHQHNDCQCVGRCTASAINVNVPADRLVQFVATVTELERRWPTPELHAGGAPPHTLPFTTGPPRA